MRSTRLTLWALLSSVLALPGFALCAETASKRQQFIYVLRVEPAFHEARNWSE